MKIIGVILEIIKDVYRGVGKIKSKCRVDGDCLLWEGGGMGEKSTPGITMDGTYYQVYAVAQQYYIGSDKEIIRYTFSCGNRRCISKAHFSAIYHITEWNPTEIWEMIHRSVDVNTEGCWLWNGCFTWTGYGYVQVCKKKYHAHLLSLLLKHTIEYKIPEIPKDSLGRNMVARHKCRNITCCNPDHLEFGSYRDNIGDARHRDNTISYGENHTYATITEEIAYQIKNSWRERNHPEYQTAKQRAEKFNVKRTLVNSIDDGYNWKHVPWENKDREKIVLERIENFRTKSEIGKHNVRKNGILPDDYEDLLRQLERKSVIGDCSYEGVPCRIWNAHVNKPGYGLMCYKGVRLLAHVVSCTIKTGYERPEGMVTRHLCNNKLCIEPSHLTFGTRSENRHDYLLTLKA